MQPEGRTPEIHTFASPEEELKYLRERVAEKEHAISAKEAEPVKKEAAISQTITEYAKDPTVKLEEHLILENPQYEKVLERMASIPHREKMRELYRNLAEKGVLSSLKMVQALGSPHLEDDFHGVLVDYIKTGVVVPGLDKEGDLSKALHMTLYEVTLPFAGAQAGEQVGAFKDTIAAMERFYLGMLPLDSAPSSRYGHFSLELVLSNFSNDIVFYVAVEEHMKDLFVKQLIGTFPTAKIEEHAGDYNIFNEFGTSVGSYAEFTSNFVYPIGDGESSVQDPFTTILNSFTKIERDGEGAAIQLVVYPDPDKVIGKVKHALGQIKQGVAVSRATDIPLSTGGVIAKSFTEFFHSQVKGEKKESESNQKAADAASKATELMEQKIASPLMRANLRVVVSAPNKDRAEAIRLSIESAFNQFIRPQSNGLKFTHAEKGRLQELLRSFTFRDINDSEALIFNTKELATIYHLPVGISQKEAPQLKTVKASSAPAPTDLPSEGTIIGINKFRGEEHEIRLTPADRLRHLYVIGQTGAGKSVFLKSLILQDIKAGYGACFIDPHGSDVQDVLSAIPKERIEDVIYFDPSYMARPFALNMLEYDINHPEQKIFVVNEMLAIFKKLYSSSPESMGPAFEQYFRNATMLVMEDPETGNTLLDIPRVLADANFRNLKLSRCKNPIVVQFWRDIATKTSGESGLQNMIPYITNKFDVFISNDIMRPIIAQEKSSFNFREIMDQKKILLVNLSKGKLGEMNANLLGLIIIGKFLMAAMSRVDSFGIKLPDFYLYVDEFQNVATPSISAILSEARKYGLSLNIAHQFIGQLPEDIKDAVFGNVGNMVTFRVGTEDAEFLELQYAPIFKSSDIMKIENLNAYAKILINGKPVPPFNISLIMPPRGNPEIIEQLRNLSFLKYGRDRKTVDDAILKKYLAPKDAAPTAPPAVRPAQPPLSAVAPAQPQQNQFAQAFAVAPPASQQAPQQIVIQPQPVAQVIPPQQQPAVSPLPAQAPAPITMPVSTVTSAPAVPQAVAVVSPSIVPAQLLPTANTQAPLQVVSPIAVQSTQTPTAPPIPSAPVEELEVVAVSQPQVVATPLPPITPTPKTVPEFVQQIISDPSAPQSEAQAGLSALGEVAPPSPLHEVKPTAIPFAQTFARAEVAELIVATPRTPFFSSGVTPPTELVMQSLPRETPVVQAETSVVTQSLPASTAPGSTLPVVEPIVRVEAVQTPLVTEAIVVNPPASVAPPTPSTPAIPRVDPYREVV